MFLCRPVGESVESKQRDRVGVDAHTESHHADQVHHKPTFLYKDNLGSNFKGRGAKLLFPKSKLLKDLNKNLLNQT